MNGKKLLLCAAAVAAFAAMPSAQAASHTGAAPTDKMMMMDDNKDGMVSKEEFMKHAGAMFDKMSKDKKMSREDYSAFLKELMKSDGSSGS